MLTSDQKGAIAESAIVHEAIKLGVGVFRPLTDGERYDLILDLRPRLLRVQCKWAGWSQGVIIVRCYSCRRSPRRMIMRTYTSEEIDAIAAYCHETERCYLLPPEVFCRRRHVHLRVDPSRNNQQLRINRADDFDLVARLEALVGP